MNRLFELFVTQVLVHRRPPGITVRDQVQMHLDETDSIDMRPDIVIRRGGVTLVADCKYKRTAPDEYINHDYYQVLSYCTALGIRRGLLLYPKGEVLPSDFVPIRNSVIGIGRLCIDLGLQWAELEAECTRFAAAVFGALSQPSLITETPVESA